MTHVSTDELDGMKEIKPPFWVWILFGAVQTGSILNISVTRSFANIYINTFHLGGIIIVVLVLGGTVLWLLPPRNDNRVDWANAILLLVAVPVISGLYGFVLYAFGATAGDVVRWIDQTVVELGRTGPFTSISRLSVAIGLPLAIGSVFYTVRFYFRSAYGATEIVVGVLVFLYGLRVKKTGLPLADTEFALGALTGSVYLVVRGIDNAYLGYKSTVQNVGAGVTNAASTQKDWFLVFLSRCHDRAGAVLRKQGRGV